MERPSQRDDHVEKNGELARLDWSSPIGRAVPWTLTILFAADTLTRAAVIPLWFDEIISYTVARLPDLSTIWAALAQTADGQPPLTHLSMRLAHTLLGTGELATRIPYLFAFAAGVWAIYRFVAVRVGSVPASLAVLLVWTSYAYRYAREARPYALVLCFAALALSCWRGAVEGRRRRAYLAGFAASLIGLVSSHYYAAVCLLPFGIGELARVLRSRKMDWGVSLAIGLSPLALLPYLPLIRQVRGEYLGHFWRPVERSDYLGFYSDALGGGLAPVSLAILAFVAHWFTERRRHTGGTSASGRFPEHESWALIGFLVLPLAYVSIALFYTQAFVPRYAIASMIGIACLAAGGFFAAFRYYPKLGKAMVVGLLAFYLVFSAGSTALFVYDQGPQAGIPGQLREIEAATNRDDLPIVIEHPLLFLQYVHYADPELKARLIYPVDVQAAREIVAADSAEVSIERLAPWGGYRAPSREEFLRNHRRFHVVTRALEEFNWFVKRLQRDGARPVEKQSGSWFEIMTYDLGEASPSE